MHANTRVPFTQVCFRENKNIYHNSTLTTAERSPLCEGLMFLREQREGLSFHGRILRVIPSLELSEG